MHALTRIRFYIVSSVTVGTQAMPTMIKMASIMKAKKTEWSQQQELPVCQIALCEVPIHVFSRQMDLFRILTLHSSFNMTKK
jgi:hypothetical protein